MFGYHGEKDGVLARMVARRRSAQRRWPFLTSIDLSMVDNDIQLSTLVKDRASLTREGADRQVDDWLLSLDMDMASTKITPYIARSTQRVRS